MPSLPTPGASEGTWADDLNAYLRVGHDIAGRHTNVHFNVKEFKHTGDPEVGTHSGDVTTTVQDCINAANAATVGPSAGGRPSAYFPAGDYYTGSGDVSLVQKCPVIGDGPHCTRFFWAGTAGAGTWMTTTGGNTRCILKGIQGRGGSPAIWYYTADVDYGDGIEDCFFAGGTQSAIYVYTGANFWMRNIRFGLDGFGITIRMNNNGQRFFQLDGFTFDAIDATWGNSSIPGFIHLLGVPPPGNGDANNIMLSVSNGRIESPTNTWAPNAGFVVLDDNWSTVPVDLSVSNITSQIDPQTSSIYVIYKTTDVAGLNGVFMNTKWDGFDDIMGGSSSASYGTPLFGPNPGIGLLSFGRSFNAINQIQELRIGNNSSEQFIAQSHLTKQAVLDFPSIAANTSADLAVPWTGIVGATDLVYANPLNGIEGNLGWCAVAINDNVVVRVINPTTSPINPASRTWTLQLWRR